jgi:hypothetical protein
MPQYLGPRDSYKYTSDTGELYSIYTDVDIAAATEMESVGSDSGYASLPRRFEPRILHWQDSQGRRKRLYVDDVNSAYWADDPQEITVAGEAGVVTGRRGEQLTIL